MTLDHSITRSVFTRSVFTIALLSAAGCGIASDSDADADDSVEPAPRAAHPGASATADPSGIGFTLRPAVHAELDAFGCEAADLGVFAGRYSSIAVFADIASLGPDRRRTSAKVFGRLSVGLPDLLSAAYIEWDLAWSSTDETVLLYGSALTPVGDTVVARLPLPRTAGVYSATIQTTNMTTGADIRDAVNCTIR